MYYFLDWKKCKDEDESLKKVSSELRDLLDSAARFPPAFAISRSRMENYSRKNTHTKDKYDKKSQDIIKSTIEDCRAKKYVFAKAKRNELGYIYSDDYYWLLKITNNDNEALVHWVSDDYYIYENPISYFKLSEVEIEQLEKNG